MRMIIVCREPKIPNKFFISHGAIKNFNTFDEFKDTGKQQYLETQGKLVRNIFEAWSTLLIVK